ncbi:hypothetical protein D3C76_1813030 [compost metagenome]
MVEGPFGGMGGCDDLVNRDILVPFLHKQVQRGFYDRFPLLSRGFPHERNGHHTHQLIPPLL